MADCGDSYLDNLTEEEFQHIAARVANGELREVLREAFAEGREFQAGIDADEE